MAVIHNRMQRATLRTTHLLLADRAPCLLLRNNRVELANRDAVALELCVLVAPLRLARISSLPPEMVLSALGTVDRDALAASPAIASATKVGADQIVTSTADAARLVLLCSHGEAA